MTMNYILASQSTFVGFFSTGDDAQIAQGVTVAHEEATVFGYGSNHTVYLAGTLLAGTYGIYLGDAAADTGNKVNISSSGSILSDGYGVNFIGINSKLNNYGAITTEGNAVNFNDGSTGASSLYNFGDIFSSTNGITHAGGSTLHIYNKGELKAFGDAIFATDGSTGSTHVTNYGLIEGNITLADGTNYIINKGTLNSAVYLQGGADVFNNENGIGVDLYVNGGSGTDTFTAGASAEHFDGGSGSDQIGYFNAKSGIKIYLDGETDNSGAATGDSLFNFEIAFGTRFADSIYGNDSVNDLNGGRGSDKLYGYGGVDTINGESGNDTIYGGTSGDTLDGGTGDDKIYGETSNDVITGGDGGDSLSGGTGNDTLTGGEGNDGYVFDTTLNASTNVDTITDFDDDDEAFEHIYLDNDYFSGVGAVGLLLNDAAFRKGTSATDTSDRIIYDSATGSLYYDADGTGGTAKIKFAIVDIGTDLFASSFIITE